MVILLIHVIIGKGFYIHGQSPGGRADTTAEELRKALDMEGKGDGRHRGLHPTDVTQLQTYEMFIPASMREKYDQMYSYPREMDLDRLYKSGLEGSIAK
jgi:hypothetical protein